MCFLWSTIVHKGLGRQRDLKVAKVTHSGTTSGSEWSPEEEKNTGNTLGNHQPLQMGIVGNHRLLPVTIGGTRQNLWWARLGNTTLLPVTPAVP